MVKKCLTPVFFFMVLVTLSCADNKKTVKENVPQEAELIEVSIGGMSCLDCEKTIQTSVGKLEGVKSVKASFTAGNAFVEFFPLQVDTLQIKEAITSSGYVVKKFNSDFPKDTIL